MTRLQAIFPVALAALSATAQAQPIHVIGTDRGGSVADYIARVQRTNAAGELVIADDKTDCESACTLWLGAKNLRISPHARFGEHWFTYDNGKPNPDGHFAYEAAMPACAYGLFWFRGAFRDSDIKYFWGWQILAACPEMKEFLGTLPDTTRR